MARINLLPWREAQREERRQRFLLLLVGGVVVAVGVILLGNHWINSAIERQIARNAYVSRQIAVLDDRIRQIGELKARREQLVERMGIIQGLQGNRPVSGRVFDQLVRTLPAGVYFTEVKRVDDTLSIRGAAHASDRVSDLMRNLEGSDWFGAPSLSEVKTATPGSSDQASLFRLTVRQAVPATTGGAE